MRQSLRLVLSASIAFVFYSGWAFYANMEQASSAMALWRVALVQGTTSGLITLGFTWLTEWSYARFKDKCVSFAFITPLICLPYHHSPSAKQFRKSINQVLDRSAQALQQRFTAVIIAPLLPMSLQGAIVISVNVINQTPNLWLTVLPSILFSGLYGYIYKFSLYRQHSHPD